MGMQLEIQMKIQKKLNGNPMEIQWKKNTIKIQIKDQLKQ